MRVGPAGGVLLHGPSIIRPGSDVLPHSSSTTWICFEQFCFGQSASLVVTAGAGHSLGSCASTCLLPRNERKMLYLYTPHGQHHQSAAGIALARARARGAHMICMQLM